MVASTALQDERGWSSCRDHAAMPTRLSWPLLDNALPRCTANKIELCLFVALELQRDEEEDGRCVAALLVLLTRHCSSTGRPASQPGNVCRGQRRDESHLLKHASVVPVSAPP